MIYKKDKNEVRKGRHRRMRNRLIGTSARPRLNVYRSLNHIYAQIIDDEIGSTLVSASTLEGALKGKLDGKNKSDAAKLMGSLLGQRAKEKGITQVVFDRGGYLYTGRVAKVAEGARESGLDF